MERGCYNLEWKPLPCRGPKRRKGEGLVPGQPGLYYRQTLWQKGEMLTYEPREDKDWCQD